MSGNRITRAVIWLCALFVLGACAQKNSDPLLPQEIKIVEAHADNNQSRFDTYAIIAMDAYDRGDFATASRFFEKLYDIDPQKEYLVDAIKAASMVKDNARIKHLIEKAKGEFGDDKFVNRYLVAYHLDKKEIDKAEQIVQKLLKNHPTQKDYELAGILASVRGDMKEAAKYYEKAYLIKHDPHVLVQLADILSKQERSDEAIRMMESHTRIYGCNKIVCTALVKIYTQKQDLKALAQIYKKLYLKTKDPLYANALLELYAYERNYDAAIAFLKKYRFSDEILLDIYTAKRDYPKARKLADTLYQKTLDPKFLAKAAVLEYESSKKKSKKLIKDVIAKFEKSVYRLDDPLYYNYYAYLLIDHDIDIDKGIDLVKKALQKEPDSLFYIDTLAWGFYKQGKCKDAWKLMQPFEKESEPEIVEHIQKIKKCLKENQK